MKVLSPLLSAALAAYKAWKSGERDWKQHKKKLEEAFPKGSSTLATESDGQMEWQEAHPRSVTDELPPEVRKACTVTTVDLDLLDAWVKTNQAKITRKGWDTSKWTTCGQTWSLVVKLR